jgi:hypothetical protein
MHSGSTGGTLPVELQPEQALPSAEQAPLLRFGCALLPVFGVITV